MLGFEWPKSPLIYEHAVVENQRINLTKTMSNLDDSLAANQRQLNEAFNFKSRTGADYSDFTDRFDDHARLNHQLKEAIGYIEQIIAADERRMGRGR